MPAVLHWKVKNALESRALLVRRELALGELDVLELGRLTDHLRANVFLLADLLDGEQLERAQQAPFDGMASAFPDTGDPVIVLNCGRPPRRRTATMLEEAAHVILGHEPCRLEPEPLLGGQLRRTYDARQEAEAYFLGSAMLLTKPRMRSDLAAERTLQQIADTHSCSTELVSFRLKRIRLYQRYQGYADAA